MCSTIENLMYPIAVLVILYGLKQLWNVAYVFVIGPMVNKVNFKSYGEWAMITGSTDGIGKEYARQLAAKGCNVILISRSFDKLTAVAGEIENEFNVKTKVIQVNFAHDDDKTIYELIAREIKDLEIGVLVNNVGTSYLYPEYFLDIPDWLETIERLLKVNCASMIRMTALVLPSMLKRKKGIIINIGSVTSESYSPLLTVYSATKAFVRKFTIGLQQEYGKDGIIVQCVTPGYVVTNMTKIKSSSFYIPLPRDFVRSALSLVNTTNKTYGYFNHSLEMVIETAMSYISESYLLNNIIKKMETIGNIFKKKVAKQRTLLNNSITSPQPNGVDVKLENKKL